MTETVDTISPWTIKAVSSSTREAVLTAAKQDGISVGTWLDRRVREWLADGSPTVVGPGQPNGRAVSVVSPRVGPSDLDRLQALVTMAQQVSQPVERDTATLRLARRAVRERLKAMVDEADNPG